MTSQPLRLLTAIAAIALLTSTKLFGTNVKDYGAKGDGIADDTEAIYNAIKNAKDGILQFPKGEYKISKTIEIQLEHYGPLGITGSNGSAAILMYGSGPALRFVGTHSKGSALPSTLSPSVNTKERMPLVESIEIRGKHPQANGIEFKNTFQPTVRGVLIRNVHHGLHYTSRNRNVLVESSHIYECTGVGIFLDAVNIHQMNIGNSHISYCYGSGIKVSGSEIRNFQITGNDIEYNCNPKGEVSADVWIDVSQGGSVREGTLTSNTIQAIQSPGGANVRFTGKAGQPNQIGLWSITGNHISNQETNIDLDHVQGVSITGNTFIRAYKRHMSVVSAENLVISGNVFDHNKDYFKADVIAPGGIWIDKSRQIMFSQNILDGVEYGNEQQGAALMVRQSQDVSIQGVQIVNPAFRGIELDGSERVSLADCNITETGPKRMIAGIVLKNNNVNCTVLDNMTGRGTGKKGVTGVEKAQLRRNKILD